MTPAAKIAAVFGRTEAGLLAGQVEDLAFLATPHTAGLRVFSSWQTRKPLAAWTVDDFYGADGIVADEEAFRARVEEEADHQREAHLLGRRSLPAGVATPWGLSQHSQYYGEGVVFHSTASHGGFHLEPELNVLVRAMLRNPSGWYEEDCEWAKVAFAFPSLFTGREREAANRTLRNDEPDAWETILGTVLMPGESFVKDRRRFHAEHSDRWVVIAAANAEGDAGMVQCTASRGGVRRSAELRTFLVPRAEYAPGQFGFVIDEARHASVDQVAAERA